MSTPASIDRRPIPIPATALGLGLAVAFAFAAAVGSPPDSTGAKPSTPSGHAGVAERVGLESCSARGCHGGVGPTNPSGGDVFIKDGAFTTWRSYDPHRKAYDALLLPRSVGIAERLRLGTPSKAAACLACHATPSAPGSKPVLADGIDCEGCHGPAKEWLEPHLAADWMSKAPASKAGVGLVDLSTPTARATSCVDCHVGNRSRGMDVNHDLIAAGHPRLNFEYASYLAAYPKHWREPTKTDIEARSWAIGQVVTARAVLRLLADRASDAMAAVEPTRAASSPWPEFAEYECFACHHSLEKQTFLPNRPGPAVGLGRLPWATWPTAMLPGVEAMVGDKSVEALVDQLKVEMAGRAPDAAKVADLSRQAVVRLDAWLLTLEKGSFAPLTIVPIADAIAKAGPDETWDVAAQRYLALAAMARSLRDQGAAAPGKEVEAILRAGPQRLAFPPRYDSPRGGRLSKP